MNTFPNVQPTNTPLIYDVPNTPGSYGDERWISARWYGFATPEDAAAAAAELDAIDYRAAQGQH